MFRDWFAQIILQDAPSARSPMRAHMHVVEVRLTSEGPNAAGLWPALTATMNEFRHLYSFVAVMLPEQLAEILLRTSALWPRRPAASNLPKTYGPGLPTVERDPRSDLRLGVLSSPSADPCCCSWHASSGEDVDVPSGLRAPFPAASAYPAVLRQLCCLLQQQQRPRQSL